jgi:hypothetical protein
MRVLGLALTLALAGGGCYSSVDGGAAGAGRDGGGGSGGMAGAGGEGGAGAMGACTNAADMAFLCDEGNALHRTLSACGYCALLGLVCPMGCDGNPIAPLTSAAACAVATLGDEACAPGLSHRCLDCYLKVSACGTLACSAICSDDPAGCACVDCVYDNCDAEFELCTGFSNGSSTTPGGPPTCEAQPTCNPPDPT